ncbi:hypothetical protein BC832DRAFT_613053 [Gaertneriomyces semiglobifer]|nr:hypothetical protein BC832DRAFT_613053 [Gaertneriomyces semiglobifer]
MADENSVLCPDGVETPVSASNAIEASTTENLKSTTETAISEHVTADSTEDAVVEADAAANRDPFPQSVLALLVHYLPKEDHISLLLLSKSWSKAVAAALYRAPPLQSSDSFERLMALLNTPLPYHDYPALIRELEISTMAADNMYIGDLDATLAACRQLEVFRLENCFHMSNILVRSLSTHCFNLKQVDMPGCPLTDSCIADLAKTCMAIERLDFSFTNLSIASLHVIVNSFPNILQVDLSECSEPDEETKDKLDFSNKTFTRPLQWLNLRNTPITDDLLRWTVTHCPNIEDLILESCTNITDDAVLKVANTCNKLRRLDVSFCDDITDLSLQAFAVRASSHNGGTLTELYLTACDNITATAVHNLAQKCTNLDLLVLDGCDKVMGTFVQSFATQPAEELECLLEGGSIKEFAQHVPGATPPSSPPRSHQAPTPKVQVSYSTAYGANPDSGWRNITGSLSTSGTRDAAAAAVAALEAAKSQSQTAAAAAANAAALHRSLSRRTSRSLLRKRSTMSLADVAAEAEAAKQERQEKIREKRRSRSYLSDANKDDDANVGELPSPDSSSVDTPTSAPTAPSAESETAIPLASGRRRSNVRLSSTESSSTIATTPSESVHSNWNSPIASPVSSGWGAGATAWNVDAPSWSQPTPPASPAIINGAQLVSEPGQMEPKIRRKSQPTPIGPPPPGERTGWVAPAGLAAPSTSSSAASFVPTPAPLPPPSQQASSGVAPSGESGVLLASGRAARAAAMAQQQQQQHQQQTQAESQTQQDPNGGILLASGRRKSRLSLSAPHTPTTATPPQIPSALPSPVSQPSAPQPWGANPPIWTNPAQLTSASSTWSTQSSQQSPSNGSNGMPSTGGGFVDPWAASPRAPAAPQSPESWSVPPLSPPLQDGNYQMPVGYGNYQQQQPPSSNTWSSPVAANNGTELRLAAGPGWSPPAPQHNGYATSQHNAWPSSAAAPTNSTSYGAPSGAPSSSGGFQPSSQNRGRLLLKLKIETKTAGHQTLGVHEFDDPAQLAEEFCRYWDMRAFREPLTRLVSVRKGNALRMMGNGHGGVKHPSQGYSQGYHHQQQQQPQQMQQPGYGSPGGMAGGPGYNGYHQGHQWGSVGH